MTGMRRGELVALRWDAVDLARSTVTVRVAASFLGGVERVEVPKTKRSRRTIDLDQRTASILKRHRATQREELFELGMTAPTDDRVFTNEVGDPMRPHSVGQAFNRLVESSGLPRIRLHDLRHTHASHLLAAGVNAKVVSERLGHSSVSFTLDTYGHVMPGQQSEAAEAAAALLS
jgi:integrase